MNVDLSIPEELYRRATEVSTAENISVDDLFAAALERLLEFERLKRTGVARKLREIPPRHV